MAFMTARGSQRMCQSGARDFDGVRAPPARGGALSAGRCAQNEGPSREGPSHDPARGRPRSGLGGGLDPRVVLEELLVELDEALPLVRGLVLGEDRLHRAHRLTRPAVDALVGMDEELRVALVDAVHGTDIDARLVLDASAGLNDHIRHLGPPDYRARAGALVRL